MSINCKVLHILLSLFFVQNIFSNPLLVVVLMVKNEATVIEATLQPFVDGGVKDFVIFDTGSDDGTPEIATQFFKKYPFITAHILQEPFVDFAISRNRALELTESLFPQAIFMFMPDAEWYMYNVEGLMRFCAEHEHDTEPAYLVNIQYIRPEGVNPLVYYVDRLIRCRHNVRFYGAVHETLYAAIKKVPEAVYMIWRPSDRGYDKSSKRWLRDRDILLKEYAKNPYDTRTIFYLAQTYECLGDWQQAYIYYKKRTEMLGDKEEMFIAAYRLGMIASVFKKDAYNEFNIPLFVEHYFIAHAMRPYRAEPIVRIAHYYQSSGTMMLAFLLAFRAMCLPYPSDDIGDIECDIYTTVRYAIARACAGYVYEYTLYEWIRSITPYHSVNSMEKIERDQAYSIRF